MKSHARVVIVGGGAVGANLLYSLTRRGWTDVVLLERTELTAGSTWHAAGLLPIYARSFAVGRMLAKSVEIYSGLEAETGQPVGFHRCGIDPDANAVDFIRQVASMRGLRVRGLLSHAGHGYKAASVIELAAVARQEAEILRTLRARSAAAGVSLDELSVGATPTLRAGQKQK